MFGKNKKMQSNADVTDIGNGSSRMKAGSSSGQIQDFSGDVGRIGADKPLKEKKKMQDWQVRVQNLKRPSSSLSAFPKPCSSLFHTVKYIQMVSSRRKKVSLLNVTV
mgnify:CR=1 FL=1